MNLKRGKEIIPGVVVYDNVIDNCEELINLATSDTENWREAKVGFINDAKVNKNARDTMALDISPIYSKDIRWFGVAQKIWQYANQYGIDFDIGFSNMEYPQLLHYPVQKGFYKPHYDSGREQNRIFSAVLYLNDVKEGGETYFNRFGKSVSPKAGRLIIFPGDYVYLHEAKTPKSNDKFAIVTWFNP